MRLGGGGDRGTLDHREREHGAGRDALLTPCADSRVYIESGATEVDRVRRAERYAQTARIAAIRIDDGQLMRSGARHRARRYEAV
jgi:hypothetical protein